MRPRLVLAFLIRCRHHPSRSVGTLLQQSLQLSSLPQPGGDGQRRHLRNHLRPGLEFPQDRRPPLFRGLGISYLFVGFLDLLHTLAYAGMGVFPQAGANLPTQLWIAARFLNSLSLFIAFGFIKRRVRLSLRLSRLCACVASVFIVALFLGNLFPDCYLEGSGAHPL